MGILKGILNTVQDVGNMALGPIGSQVYAIIKEEGLNASYLKSVGNKGPVWTSHSQAMKNDFMYWNTKAEAEHFMRDNRVSAPNVRTGIVCLKN